MRRCHPPSQAAGYTLVELLLTVSLVVLLVGAVVFNFSSAANGARLDEGAGQVEALFRFARAHAETTGRQVRIQFPEAESGDTAELLAAEAPGTTVRVTWEADPIGAPGVFQDLPEAATYVQSISGLVSIQQVQAEVAGADLGAGLEDLEAEPGSLAKSGGEGAPELGAFVTFFPDGTGDSVEVLLTSRDEVDARRLTLRWMGITGAIRRQIVAEVESAESEPPAPATEAAAEAVQ
jgi:type II secretory pathway pseudopilin PulG